MTARQTSLLDLAILPCNANGLPLTDSFMATSFKVIEDYFATTGISKCAVVYMAQGMSEVVPAFYLACIGNNNQFTAELVLKRWQYLHRECKKRGITAISFGADCDSRELKAMQVSSHIFLTPIYHHFLHFPLPT